MRFIPMILTLTLLVHARTIHLHYDVKFAIFGTIGTADAVIKTQKRRYTIELSVKTTGMVKYLSGNRQETHRSEGHIQNGMLIADHYEVMRSYRNKKIVKHYRFDHHRRNIIKYFTEYCDGKIRRKTRRTLPFYAKDDLLSLYANLRRYIFQKKPGLYRFKAAGSERQGGEVKVIVPSKRDYPRYHNKLGQAYRYVSALINQKDTKSKKGMIEFALEQDGFAKKVFLEDVAFFGDVTAIRR